MRKILNLFIVVAIIFSLVNFTQAAENSSEKYRLEKVFMFSRHNVRSPTSGGSKILPDVTNIKWTWTSNTGELSQRGGLLETAMGEYFRQYLEHENFITENFIPNEDEFLFFANSRQRTIATAQYFSSGFLPVANVKINHKYSVKDTQKRDSRFEIKYDDRVNEDFRREVSNEILTEYNIKNFNELSEIFKPEIDKLEKIVDFKNSPYAKKNNLQHFPADDFEFVIEKNKSAEYRGSFNKAVGVSDAMLMQYYETPANSKEGIASKWTEKQLRDIAKIHSASMKILYGTPSSSLVFSKPLMPFLRDEIANDRKFTFICGHDSNILTFLTALGVEDYNLPNTLESCVPIGVKFVIEKRIGNDGREYANIYFAYQTTKQIKNLEVLSLKNPPQKVHLKFKNLQENEDGLYLYSDVIKLFDDTIAKAN